MRSKEHLERLESFLKCIENEDSKEAARKIDAVLDPLYVYLHEDEDGNEIISWSSESANFQVLMTDFQIFKI